MSTFLQVIDILACWVLMIVSLFGLMTIGSQKWRQVICSIGMLIVLGGCFVGAVVIWETGHRTPWAVAQRVGCAMTAVWGFDVAFGWHRQALAICAWLKSLPGKARELRERVRL